LLSLGHNSPLIESYSAFKQVKIVIMWSLIYHATRNNIILVRRVRNKLIGIIRRDYVEVKEINY
jgi:hypothetical protein